MGERIRNWKLYQSTNPPTSPRRQNNIMGTNRYKMKHWPYKMKCCKTIMFLTYARVEMSLIKKFTPVAYWVGGTNLIFVSIDPFKMKGFFLGGWIVFEHIHEIENCIPLPFLPQRSKVISLYLSDPKTENFVERLFFNICTGKRFLLKQFTSVSLRRQN